MRFGRTDRAEALLFTLDGGWSARTAAETDAAQALPRESSPRSAATLIAAHTQPPEDSTGARRYRGWHHPARKTGPIPPGNTLKIRGRNSVGGGVRAIGRKVDASKLVAHPENRLQTVADVTKLLAQVESMGVDGASAAHMAITPDAQEQLLPGKDTVDALDEKTEELKFVGRQPEGFAAPISLLHLAVEHDLAVSQLQWGSRPTVTNPELPQPGRQLLQGDREQNEVVRADLGGKRHDPSHLEAKQDPRRYQLGTLPQPLNGVSADLQVFPRLDGDHVRRHSPRLQLGQVVTRHDHLMPEGTQ